jgi:hypothetical protein
MKREGKYRAKRVDNGEWAYGYYFEVSLQYGNRAKIHVLADNNDEESVDKGYWVDRETVGEFSGFIDRKNNRIYTGDVHGSEIKYVIKFIGGAFCSGSEKYGYSPLGWIAHNGSSELHEDNFPSTIEIIGNIYDNPELIQTT